MASSFLRALGLMSGTSVDGVDVALIETDGERVSTFGPTLTVPYPDAARRLIRAAFGATAETEATRAAEQIVTDLHVAAVRAWGEKTGIGLDTVDLVGFHGQTITHQPDRRFTWQIGNGAVLARALGLRVVNDLRRDDVAAGGQGAPLVPVYHAALAADLRRPLAVVNIGGVGNVTWIGTDGALLAFDTGPGNGPIDDCGARASLTTGTVRWRRRARSIAAGSSASPSIAFSRSRHPNRSIAATSTTPGPKALALPMARLH